MSVKKAFHESLTQIHPLVVFWLGLLTGAIAVGLLFFYRAMDNADYESAILRLNTTRVAPTSTYTTQPMVAPTSTTSLKSIGDPTGGFVSIGDPTGG